MKSPFVEWGVAGRALQGQTDTGDRHLVRPQSDGALLAVVDGLGHGKEAARAADLAIRMVERLAGEPPLSIVTRCHEGLLGTRGVTLSLARWDGRAGELIWLGVGDVTGILLRAGSGPGAAGEHLLRRVGVVGVMLTPLLVRTVTLERGGLLILATDGIAAGFDGALDPRDPPASLADRILERYSKETDDALVLVARLVGMRR